MSAATVSASRDYGHVYLDINGELAIMEPAEVRKLASHLNSLASLCEQFNNRQEVAERKRKRREKARQSS